MKKTLKIIMVVILAVVLLIAGVIFWVFHSLKTELGDHWMDYANAFTLQTEARKDLPPLENIEQYTVDVQYINKTGAVDSRPIRLYVPGNVSRPMPLIYQNKRRIPLPLQVGDECKKNLTKEHMFC